MNDLIKSSALTDRFRNWLDSGEGRMAACPDGKPAAELITLRKNPSARYLYMARTGKDGAISWDKPVEFAGAYSIGGHMLYLTRDALVLLSNGSSPLAAEAGGSMRKKICDAINRRVEEIISDDRNNLPIREITGEMPRRRIGYYREHGARQDAIKLLFDGEAPDGRFHSGYDMDYLPEKDFLAYIEDPDGFVDAKAREHIGANVGAFLMRFLENDALLSEYRSLMQDAGDPVHRMKAITDAVNVSGAKTVTVTVRKDGKELTFKAEAYSLLGHQSYYSTYHIQAQDRRKFKETFGQHADYNASDIVRIAYGRKTIYEAREATA